MIYDWLANQECLFPGKSSTKVDVFGVGWEKRSDVHTKEDNKKRNISKK